MLHIKTTKREIKTTEELKVVEMINKYFWCSRAVYAVEFRENIYSSKTSEQWNEVTLIKIEFEKNIILSKRIQFSDKHPICLSPGLDPEWVEELFTAYLKEGYFDSRTKESFDNDFNNVIASLRSIR
jgi:hypothetical protein